MAPLSCRAQCSASARAALLVASLCIAGAFGSRSQISKRIINRRPGVDEHEQLAVVPDGDLVVVEAAPEQNTLKEIIYDIAGGTGASVSGTGDTSMDQALLQRMRNQDRAVMWMLLLAYLGTLLFSASFAHRQARNSSPVTFYADPRFHNMTTEGDDVEAFLSAFNGPPADAQLQVTGLIPLPALADNYFVDNAVTWLGAQYRVAFSFALDISPWIVPCGARGDDADDWSAGVLQEDVERLAVYLANDKNDLSYVELRKQVEWKDWEELATNIKSKIRQGGFTGHIDVRRKCDEAVAVHKNRQWANFLHSRTTKVLLALSVGGWLLVQPYMWLRHYAVTIPCKYRVDVTIDQYWPLIQDKIGADGFNPSPQANIRAERRRSAAPRSLGRS